MSSSSSVLCFGQGDIKDFFSKGQLGFQPAMMKFLGAGETLNTDEQFMTDWAEGIKQGIKRVSQMTMTVISQKGIHSGLPHKIV